MAFEKIFQGSPTANDVVTSASPQNPQLGVDVNDDSLWVNSGQGWTEVGGTAGAVTTTGSPASGNLAKFSGTDTITNADLTGDVTTSGGVATTLATVNSNVGSFTNANITVNAKGLVTAAANGSAGGGGNFVNIGSAVTFAMGGGGAGSFSGGAFTVTTPGTSITISSIPGTYLNLKLVGVLQGNASTPDAVNLQFNGDSGGNYDYSYIYGGGSLGASGTHNDGQSSAIVAFLADSGQVAHYPSPVEILIPTYAGTTFWKTFIANSMRNNNSNPDFDVFYVGGGWHNTAAITSITLFPLFGPNFTAGSTISIYGLN